MHFGVFVASTLHVEMFEPIVQSMLSKHIVVVFDHFRGGMWPSPLGIIQFIKKCIPLPNKTKTRNIEIKLKTSKHSRKYIHTYIYIFVHTAFDYIGPPIQRISITWFCRRLGPDGPMGPRCLVTTVCAPWSGQHTWHWICITWLCTRKNQVLPGKSAYVIKTSVYTYI